MCRDRRRVPAPLHRLRAGSDHRNRAERERSPRRSCPSLTVPFPSPCDGAARGGRDRVQARSVLPGAPRPDRCSGGVSLIQLPPGVPRRPHRALDGWLLNQLNASFESRSLPPTALRQPSVCTIRDRGDRARPGVNRSAVVRQPGGAIRYTIADTSLTVRDLLVEGSLRRITRCRCAQPRAELRPAAPEWLASAPPRRSRAHRRRMIHLSKLKVDDPFRWPVLLTEITSLHVPPGSMTLEPLRLSRYRTNPWTRLTKSFTAAGRST